MTVTLPFVEELVPVMVVFTAMGLLFVVKFVIGIFT